MSEGRHHPRGWLEGKGGNMVVVVVVEEEEL